jgi:hypothetical protein
MVAVLVQLLMLAAGLGATEIGLGGALVGGSPAAWALVLFGLVLIVAGSAGFMVTLLGGGKQKGTHTDA